MSTFTDYYVGYEVEGYYLTTTTFKTLEEAQTSFNIISAANPTINYHITSTVHSYVPHLQTNSNVIGNQASVSSSVEPPFTGMIYESFGKGFLLRPTASHPDFGTKYYHNGWWVPSLGGWFFKTQYLNDLIMGGAGFSSLNPANKTGEGTDYSDMPDLVDSSEEEYGDSNDSSADIDEDEDNNANEYEDIGPFTGMHIDTYGRGYLLVPPEGHPNYGEKYFHNGWWLTNQNAWFFKTKDYDNLIDNGAIIQTNQDTGSESNQTDNTDEGSYSGMNVTSYGRGYLLTPTENHPDYGCKYYGDGWWMPKHSAWFFKNNHYQSLINNGAIAV